MFRLVKLFLCLVSIILLQVALFPTYLENSFKPNLMIILVCFLALRGENAISGAAVAYFSGLLYGVFSGLYFGLSGISFLLIYLFLRKISDQLYTESNHLMIFAVMVASLADPLISLVFITLFSISSGVYASILANMIPQSLVTSFFAAVIFPAHSLLQRRFLS